LRGFNRIALEIDSRVREYDELLRNRCNEVVEELEFRTENDILAAQESTIKKLGGSLESQKNIFESRTTKKSETHLETYEYIEKGMTLDEIAQIRNLKPLTILTHLEKLLEEKKKINLTPYRPTDDTRFNAIHEAFVTLGTLKLAPVHAHLYNVYDEEYSFEELRMARLFLSEEDRLAIESVN
jgi:uncharacterized protein YpbB